MCFPRLITANGQTGNKTGTGRKWIKRVNEKGQKESEIDDTERMWRTDTDNEAEREEMGRSSALGREPQREKEKTQSN